MTDGKGGDAKKEGVVREVRAAVGRNDETDPELAVRVRVGAEESDEDPWVRFRRSALPEGVDSPKAGDVVFFRPAEATAVYRVVAGKAVGGRLRRA